MANASHSVPSLSRLPYELQAQIADEVSRMLVSALDGQERSIPYSEWVSAVHARMSLAQGNSIFWDLSRDVQHYQLWIRCYGRAQFRWRQIMPKPDPNLNRTGPAVTHFRDIHHWYTLPHDLCSMYRKLMIAWERPLLGPGHVPLRWGPEAASHDKAIARIIGEYIQRYIDAKRIEEEPVNFPPRLSRFVREWPCESLKYLTLCIGFGCQVGWDFRDVRLFTSRIVGGRPPRLPSAAHKDICAELLVNVFPFLERVNIVRAPLHTSAQEKQPGGRVPLRDIDAAMIDVRSLFGERVPEELWQIPTSTGIRPVPLHRDCTEIGLVEWKNLPRILEDEDADFLRRVNGRIRQKFESASRN